jgi:hypothetical protein
MLNAEVHPENPVHPVRVKGVASRGRLRRLRVVD